MVTPGLLVTVERLKKCKENEHKVHTNAVNASVKKINPKETPKRPRQCYNCTECNSTFDSMHKLKKHTRDQHEGKYIKSPVRKSPRTEPKTNIKLAIQTMKNSKNKLLQREKK